MLALDKLQVSPPWLLSLFPYEKHGRSERIGRAIGSLYRAISTSNFDRPGTQPRTVSLGAFRPCMVYGVLRIIAVLRMEVD